MELRIWFVLDRQILWDKNLVLIHAASDVHISLLNYSSTLSMKRIVVALVIEASNAALSLSNLFMEQCCANLNLFNAWIVVSLKFLPHQWRPTNVILAFESIFLAYKSFYFQCKIHYFDSKNKILRIDFTYIHI